MFDLKQIQQALADFQLDGWLLYDFRGINILAQRVLEIPEGGVASRRFCYYIPQSGTPQKLVHRIERSVLDHLPGEETVYLRWQEFEQGIQSITSTGKKIAMEYSPRNNNPYISRVDAGTVELIRSFGKEIVSSGDLVQYFEARLTNEQWQLHLQADKLTRAAFKLCWSFIRDNINNGKSIRETDVQTLIMDYFTSNKMTTYHPPIVAVNEHSGDPHYEPVAGSDSEIQSGDFVLIDMWAKMDVPLGVYSDLTKVAYVGDSVPAENEAVFQVVAAARDAAIEQVKNGFQNQETVFGWQVDQAARDVIGKAGYGDFFIHRTGHNIGQETHGNGAHMDNLETQEDRTVMPGTLFSIEPGIYLPEFGVRSEINVFVSEEGEVHVTGEQQQSVLPLLA